MDLSTGWSLIRVAQSGAAAVAGANPLSFAISATFLLKKWVDSQNAEMLDNVRKREGCPHIAMVEGSPPTSCATLYVAEHGGVAWLVDRSAFWFCHPDRTFKPLVFQRALVQGPRGVRLLSPAEFAQEVPRPADGYGCSECRNAQKGR